MAVVNGYCTVPDLRAHLQDSGSRLDTDLLERAITAASRAVDAHCGRRFWQDTVPATKSYVAPYPDVAWVDDISETGALVVEVGGPGSWSALTLDSDFVLWPDIPDAAHAWWRIEMIDGAIPRPVGRARNLRVTAKFGWSDVPDAVRTATILKAASLFQRKDAVFGVAGFGEFGPVRITRKDPDVYDLLHDYVRGWA